jgi:hypothetical protein
MNLHRFWFKFGALKRYKSIRLGCGVTARDYDDAITILRETIFAGKEFPQIESFIQDVDLSELDQNHVIPNMEPPVWRGVWFPKGYGYTLYGAG